MINKQARQTVFNTTFDDVIKATHINCSSLHDEYQDNI